MIWLLPIACLLFLILFLLSDDKREIINYVKGDWKTLVLVLIPVIIYVGYPIYIMVGVFGLGAEEHLWNPYIFGGMPSYALSTGYAWWNLIYVTVNTTTNVLHYNPVGVLLFTISIWWYFKKRNSLRYLLVLFTEVAMLYFAFWNLSVAKGWL